MEGTYEVKLWDKPVGKVQVRREGLYYRFICRCQLGDETVCRVNAGNVSLGILIPIGDGFGLNTKLPVKRFDGNSWEFRIMPNRPVLEGRFIPIKPEEPFAYIARLKDAYLAKQDGQIGIIIREEAGT